ncbi:putative antirestriction protein [Aeromonas phage phiA050]
MDSQAIIDRITQDVKDKTLLVRFFNLQNGVDLWIDALCWRCYDFDMKVYLKGEFGIELWDMKLSYNVLKSDEDFINSHCFYKGVFDTSKYNEIQELLADTSLSQECIAAGLDSGLELNKIEDLLEGEYKDFLAFATQRFNDLYGDEIPDCVRPFIDYEAYADSIEQDYYFTDGYVFDATR